MVRYNDSTIMVSSCYNDSTLKVMTMIANLNELQRDALIL